MYSLSPSKGEAGILVAPLTAMNQFLGYAGNKVQSEKKLLRGVFKAGDVYFNTGDLLMHDHRDFLYFRDRVGDTFRYRHCRFCWCLFQQPPCDRCSVNRHAVDTKRASFQRLSVLSPKPPSSTIKTKENVCLLVHR